MKKLIYQSPSLRGIKVILESVIAASSPYEQGNVGENDMKEDVFENENDFQL